MSEYTDSMKPVPGEDNKLAAMRAQVVGGHEVDDERLENAAKVYRDLREESDGDLLKRLGTDASEWATEFALRFPGAPDIDTLRAWFANALEAGASEGHNRSMNEIHDTAKRLGVDLTEVWTPGHAAEVFYDKTHPRFTEAAELEEYLQHLNELGMEPEVAILDQNNIVWLTYGEEHSSGGEASAHHLLQGDPLEDFMVERDENQEDDEGEHVYVAIPLTQPKYPVRLLFDPLAS